MSDQTRTGVVVGATLTEIARLATPRGGRAGFWVNNRAAGQNFNAISLQARFGPGQNANLPNGATPGTHDWHTIFTSTAPAGIIVAGANLAALATGSQGYFIIICSGMVALRLLASVAAATTTVDTTACCNGGEN